MDLKTLASFVSNLGFILGVLDYFGLSAYLENFVDTFRKKIGEMVNQIGIFRPVIKLVDAILPKNIYTTPIGKVAGLAMIGSNAITVVIISYFFYAILYIGEFFGFVDSPENTVWLVFIKSIELSLEFIEPIKHYFPNDAGFNNVGTLLSMTIFSVFGYIAIAITIISLLFLLYLLHRFLLLTDKPKQGTIATFGFLIGIVGYVLDKYFL